MTMTTDAPPDETVDETVVHVLWINAGLSCDGDSVALTAATQPSIEEIALGALPGLPKIAVHWPLIDFECGRSGATTSWSGSSRPTAASSSRSCSWSRARSPTRAIKSEGYWAGSATTRRPASRSRRASGSTGWRRRRSAMVARRHLRHLRRHPRHGGQPDRRDGPARLPRLELEVEGRHADRVRARLPGAARQLHGDPALPAVPGRRATPR